MTLGRARSPAISGRVLDSLLPSPASSNPVACAFNFAQPVPGGSPLDRGSLVPHSLARLNFVKGVLFRVGCRVVIMCLSASDSTAVPSSTAVGSPPEKIPTGKLTCAGAPQRVDGKPVLKKDRKIVVYFREPSPPLGFGLLPGPGLALSANTTHMRPGRRVHGGFEFTGFGPPLTTGAQKPFVQNPQEFRQGSRGSKVAKFGFSFGGNRMFPGLTSPWVNP